MSVKLFRDSIRLISHEQKSVEGVCYASQYVLDCVAADRLLKINKYQKIEQVEDSRDGEDSGTESRARKRPTKSELQKGRINYTHDEDMGILQYILKTRKFESFKGTTMWRKMQKANVMSNTRTWQSLRERFLKKILPDLDRYELRREEKRYLQNVVDSSKNSASVRNARLYTKDEDVKILKYIIKQQVIDKTKGNVVWKQMEQIKVTARSWQGMKDRFRKNIVYNLGDFSIRDKHREQIEDLYGICNTNTEPSQESSSSEAASVEPSTRCGSPEHHSDVAGPSRRPAVSNPSKARKRFLTSKKIVPLLFEASPEPQVANQVECTRTTSVAEQPSQAVEEMDEASAPVFVNVAAAVDESSEEDLPDVVKRLLDDNLSLTPEDKFEIQKWIEESLHMTGNIAHKFIMKCSEKNVYTS